MTISKSHKVHEMASGYRFDYSEAKPNRFAEKMNLNMGWAVEKFVASPVKMNGAKTASANSRANGKAPSAKKTAPAKKAKAPTKKRAVKAKPSKTSSPKGERAKGKK